MASRRRERRFFARIRHWRPHGCHTPKRSPHPSVGDCRRMDKSSAFLPLLFRQFSLVGCFFSHANSCSILVAQFSFLLFPSLAYTAKEETSFLYAVAYSVTSIKEYINSLLSDFLIIPALVKYLSSIHCLDSVEVE